MVVGNCASTAFPWILTVVETSGFQVLKVSMYSEPQERPLISFGKVIEPAISAILHRFPFLVGHFHVLEQAILQQHLWAIGSDLMASLRHPNRSLPTASTDCE